MQVSFFSHSGIFAVGAGFYIKHLLYEQGVKDATMKHVTAEAGRTIESEHRSGRSLATSEAARVEGDTQVADLRRRAARSAAEAKAARSRAESLARKSTVGKACLPVPILKTCPADSRLVQP